MLEDYQHDYSKVYSWLSWGGLILPEVVGNKEDFLMGFSWITPCLPMTS